MNTDRTHGKPSGTASSARNGMNCLHTMKQTASILSISVAKLYQLTAGKQIQTVKIGRSSRITTEEIERFIESLRNAV